MRHAVPYAVPVRLAAASARGLRPVRRRLGLSNRQADGPDITQASQDSLIGEKTRLGGRLGLSWPWNHLLCVLLFWGLCPPPPWKAKSSLKTANQAASSF